MKKIIAISIVQLMIIISLLVYIKNIKDEYGYKELIGISKRSALYAALLESNLTKKDMKMALLSISFTMAKSIDNKGYDICYLCEFWPILKPLNKVLIKENTENNISIDAEQYIGKKLDKICNTKQK